VRRAAPAVKETAVNRGHMNGVYYNSSFNFSLIFYDLCILNILLIDVSCSFILFGIPLEL
jgi:hypothetical protein